MSIITPQQMAQDVLKIMDDVAAGFPEEDRERLKAVMLGHWGMALFNGLVESNKQPKENT